jgi:4-amino-4-deoxy-L-arabinose transferase-like glycosyltransferase
MEDTVRPDAAAERSYDRPGGISRRQVTLIVFLFAAAVYIGCIFSPPSLMDDVDAVQAQIAVNMMHSGHWVTARLDGVPYLEKPPLIYWMMAGSFKLFGVHTWSARVPVVLSAIALCLVTAWFGIWAFERRKAGLYAGLCMATCIGLWLFTRIQIPNVTLVLTITLTMWAFLRLIEDDVKHPRWWAVLIGICFGTGLLLESLIGVVFPIGAWIVYFALTKRLFRWDSWKRLHPVLVTVVMLAVAAPWHILATLRNPPYFVFTMKSIPGQWHGFLWFFFINEQLLRFLNMRYPRDYATVPRYLFWLFNLIWLFPWSVYIPATFKLSYKPLDRAGRTRLLALCWIGVVMVFFTFSTTQEYYSMPIYPAIALLVGSALLVDNKAKRWGTRALTIICTACAISAIGILIAVRHVPTPGDISHALVRHPSAYKLSLGHMEDLTLDSFAYLRFPLGMAAVAFLIGAASTLRTTWKKSYLGVALMMVVFFQAAHAAMATFDPYMSSRPLIRTLQASPPGKLMIDHHYYYFSSLFFYTDRKALMLNGRYMNLVYGSYSPRSEDPFIDNAQFQQMWMQPQRWYMFAKKSQVEDLVSLVGADHLYILDRAGDKVLFTNEPVPDRAVEFPTAAEFAPQ